MSLEESPEFQKLYKEWKEKVNKVPMNNRIHQREPERARCKQLSPKGESFLITNSEER